MTPIHTIDPTVVADDHGRRPEDALTAELHNWFHKLLSTRALRVIAEAITHDLLINEGFAIIPITDIETLVDYHQAMYYRP